LLRSYRPRFSVVHIQGSRESVCCPSNHNRLSRLNMFVDGHLESLSLRIFGQPRPGVTLYQLLTSPDPRSTTNETVFLAYKNKLMVAAELVANG